MPPDLGRPYAPDWPGNPPHMAHTDLPLWQRFRPQLSPKVVEWYFDVAVGDGNPTLLDDPSSIVQSMYRLSRLRIDAVGRGPDLWHLIELRPNAGLGALGHITSYRALWERDPIDTTRALAWLVSDRYQSDVARTAMNAGILLRAV